jgi:hypothetical protein
MGLVQRDHVIQQILAAAQDPTLRNAILPRTLDGSADTLYFHRPNRTCNSRPIFGILIKDQKPESGLIGEGFPRLLYISKADGMPRHVEI